MAVVAVGGNPLVTFLGRGFKADNNSFLSDIKVAEPANQTHAIKLARLFLESADQQHFAIEIQQFLGGNIWFCGTFRRCLACGHASPSCRNGWIVQR